MLQKHYPEGTIGHAVVQFEQALAESGEQQQVDPAHDIVHAITGLGEEPCDEAINLIYDMTLGQLRNITITDVRGDVQRIEAEIKKWRFVVGETFDFIGAGEIADHYRNALAMRERFHQAHGVDIDVALATPEGRETLYNLSLDFFKQGREEIIELCDTYHNIPEIPGALPPAAGIPGARASLVGAYSYLPGVRRGEGGERE